MRFLSYNLYIGLFIVGLQVTLLAQTTLRKYRSLDYMEFLREANPALENDLAHLERDLSKNYFENNIAQITLPVVFHVLYSNDDEKISEQQIYDQIASLNKDFLLENQVADHINDPEDEFQLKASSALISFCRANRTPDNQVTNGINYVQVKQPVWYSFTEMKDKKAGGVEPWNTIEYINIWVCHLPDDNAGFAQFPYGDQKLDGIVIDYRYIKGASSGPYSLGRTLTHLMGNYLNLYPLWGEKPCGDDYIDDTPVHNDINYGCPGDNHITACRGNSLEMTMNFMDNTDDACSYMFTKGQMIRMQNTILAKGARHSLISTSTDCSLEMIEYLLSDGIPAPPAEVATKYQDPQIIPNPVTEQIFINMTEYHNAQPITLNIISNTGRNIQKATIPVGTQQYNLSLKHLPPGIYLVILANDAFKYTKSLVKI